jgi:hypothetical protein
MALSVRLPLALALSPLLVASCGARAGLDVGATVHGAGAESGAPDGAVPDSGSGQGGDAYTGVVSALVLRGSTGETYTAFADFQPAPPLRVGACPDGQACCCLHGTPLPFPTPPPDAAAVTLASAEDAATLATLMPSTTTFQGTWDLGEAWATHPGAYPDAMSEPWAPGAALRVSAAGGAVHPFSGTIHTSALLSGVTPPLGPSPLAVDRSQPLQVSWAPEGKSGEVVTLMLQQFTSAGVVTCYCGALDAAAKLTVDSGVLAEFGTDQLSARLRLERLLTSFASAGDATVTLVGEVAETGPITFF